jgi:ribosome maturation factor RimP
MTHPLIPQLLDLAIPIAENIGLEVVGAVFHTDRRPPVLRVDIRNGVGNTGLNDCERMSRALEEHTRCNGSDFQMQLCFGNFQPWDHTRANH